MQQVSGATTNASTPAGVPGRAGAVPSRKNASARAAFVPALSSLLVAFATVGSTIPLFNNYRTQEGFTNGDISLTVVAYSAATLPTLLTFGRLSHHVGRPVAIASLLLLAAGSLVLLDVQHLGILVGGRVLMGVGAGLASSRLAPYIVDAAPARPVWLVSVASSQTVMLCLAVGAVTSGALVQFAPWSRDLSFLVLITLLLISIALIAGSPETAPRTRGAWRSLGPHVSAPAHVRTLLRVAVAVLLATWSIGSFYQAFVPVTVEGNLHTKSSLVLGLVFAAYMATSALRADQWAVRTRRDPAGPDLQRRVPALLRRCDHPGARRRKSDRHRHASPDRGRLRRRSPRRDSGHLLAAQNRGRSRTRSSRQSPIARQTSETALKTTPTVDRDGRPPTEGEST
jgi:hypothetical protein